METSVERGRKSQNDHAILAGRKLRLLFCYLSKEISVAIARNVPSASVLSTKISRRFEGISFPASYEGASASV